MNGLMLIESTDAIISIESSLRELLEVEGVVLRGETLAHGWFQGKFAVFFFGKFE